MRERKAGARNALSLFIFWIKERKEKGMNINVMGSELTEKEISEYRDRGLAKYGQALLGMDIRAEGDEVELTYHLAGQPFERIRRITGYLTGTLDKWNDAKRAEERERVKHGL